MASAIIDSQTDTANRSGSEAGWRHSSTGKELNSSTALPCIPCDLPEGAVAKVFWLFGRSGAGKTTLARHLLHSLATWRVRVFFLDGDEMRAGLCSDLDFSSEARIENHRRIAEVANLAAGQGYHVIVSTMAPQHSQRNIVAQVLGNRLVWVYVHAPLDVCIQRDPKGLYRQAKGGQNKSIMDFPFDPPRLEESQHLIDTVTDNLETCCLSIQDMIRCQLGDLSI